MRRDIHNKISSVWNWEANKPFKVCASVSKITSRVFKPYSKILNGYDVLKLLLQLGARFSRTQAASLANGHHIFKAYNLKKHQLSAVIEINYYCYNWDTMGKVQVRIQN